MCEFLSIRVEIAQQWGLGLFVKQRPSPEDEEDTVVECIGMFNEVVHGHRAAMEQQRKKNADGLTDACNHDSSPEKNLWLTVSIDKSAGVCWECLGLRTHLLEENRKEYMVYSVVGVWYFAPSNDGCVGARPTANLAECDALLL